MKQIFLFMKIINWIIVLIFCKRKRDFLGLELRDIAEDNVSKKDIKLWIQDFIKYDPDDKLFSDYPDFL